MAPKSSDIDPDKLRAALRKLRSEAIFLMFDEAIELLPPAKLHQLVKKHLDVEQLRPDVKKGKVSLLMEVKSFEKASLAGDYYESFDVNSKNFSEQSTGTTSWIAAFRRLLDRCCVAAAKKEDLAEVRAAIDILFGLLDHIDKCLDDVIFFADEGGSWQVGVDWERVLPAWFTVLSATADPDEYARRIKEVVSNHYNYGREKMLVIARNTATPEQRKAL